MRKLLITEEDRNHIIGLYNINYLKEDTNTSSFETSKKIEFPAGYYNESYLSGLYSEIEKVETFLRTNISKDYNISVTVEAGESRIPNYDKEVEPNIPVGQFYLANKRYETISNFMTMELQKLKDLVKNTPVIEKPVLKLGDTQWVGQDFCPSESLSDDDKNLGRECLNRNFNKTKSGRPNWVNGKNDTYKDLLSAYTEEQFVKVYINVTEISKIEKPCMDNMEIQLNYSVDRGHVCNSSVYEVRINGVLLSRDDGEFFASLNNGIGKNDFNDKKTYNNKDIQFYDNAIKLYNKPNKAGFRYNTFIITPEIAASLMTGNQNEFDISVKCVNPTNTDSKVWGVGCHKEVGDIKIINGRGQIYDYIAETPRNKNEEKIVLTIDSCGKKIVTT